MSNDKTLATAKHGGCVQLSTSERERFEAWASDCYHIQRMGDLYRSALTTNAWQAWQAALSAQPSPATCKECLQVQPSPGGQGDAVRHSPEDYRDARIILARNMKRVAGKHNVPNLAADADVVESGEEYDFWMDAAYDAVREALAARQPAGEPFGWWLVDCNGIGRLSRTPPQDTIEIYRNTPGYSATPLYTASPAQAVAVDLGAVADVLRELLTERQHRTDGSLMELAERCRHLSRGDRDCIALRGTLITELEAQAVDLGEFRPMVDEFRRNWANYGRTMTAAGWDTSKARQNVDEADRLLALIDSQAVRNG